METYVEAPQAECERRDPKGLYAKARAGLIPEFTGVSAPYEAPAAPDLRLDGAGDLDAAVEAVLRRLQERGSIAPRSRPWMSQPPDSDTGGRTC